MSVSDDITVRSTKNFAIRDVNPKDWDINLERYGQIAVYIINNLNQNIVAQYFGGTAAAPVLLVGKGGVIASGGGTDSEDFTGAMGWVRIRITAAGVPANGAVTVIVDGEKGTQTAAELHGPSHGRGAEDEATDIFDEIDAIALLVCSGTSSGICDRMYTLEAEMDALQIDVTDLEDIVGTCTSGVGSGLCQRTEQLEEAINTHGIEITNLQTDVNTLDNIIGTCLSGLGSGLCQRIESLESEIDDINITLDTHETDIDKNKNHQYTFMVSGALTSGTDVTMWQDVLQNCTLTELRALVKSVCSGLGGIGMGIDRSLDCGETWNGLITPAQFNIPCGDHCVTVSGLSVALAKDDMLRLNLDSVGEILAAEDLHIFLRTEN